MPTHHPGPPRFTHVGETVELAPRNPTTDATFRWSVGDRPTDSTASVGDGPVVQFAPDEPGVYRLELDAPDGTHSQTVRAFPDPRTTVRFELSDSELPIPQDEVEKISVAAPFNDYTLGRDRPARQDGGYVAEFDLPPGDHEAIFVVNDDFELSTTVDATVEGPGRPRVELDATVEGDEVVVTATEAAAPSGDAPNVEFYLDDRDDLSADAVSIEANKLRAPIDSLPSLARVHAVSFAERHSVGDTVLLETSGSDVAVTRPNDPPEWAEDATMYEIFVRSFAGETVETTFEEIERRVEYLESLGVDVVWLTPVLESPTKHGYHITDFFDTATDLGTREEFLSLVERCHDADIRVVFDLVINHTSRDHPAFQMHRAGVESYADHYEQKPAEKETSDVDWAGENAPGYYFNWTRIPNVNYDSLAVRQWMLNVVEEWASVVDGFRCDVAWGVPHGFWKEVRERVSDDEGDDFLLMDETIPRDPDFHENEFDVHYDTTLYGTLREIGQGERPADAVFDALEDAKRHGFPDSALHLRYVENHDEDRYVGECGEDALRAAAAATLTMPGVPMIYYGQERGMKEYRGTMRWHDGDADLTEFHRRLVHARNEHPALRAEGVEPVAYDADSDGVTAYAREDEDERLVVVLNFDAEPRAVDVDVADTTDLLTGEDVNDGEEVLVEDVVVLEG
ncbi:alpha-amylase family glycosyl hydrolase [Halorussus halophilus]|uniref:alpha-amylase family glycosyl hydrolase n=1 Tax=Halorussus halophilus TaxID=2650975 RepID=UPI001300F26D|nr:alpha-amylase family glycosyl hydrolase [Halorussus halophilus]